MATGLLEFRHYGARVLAVDFTRDRVTDFGYTGYSMTTSGNIRAWMCALRGMLFQGLTCLNMSVDQFRWTASDRYNKDSIKYLMRGKGYALDMFLRFRAGVPWVKDIDGSPWFCARQYDPALEAHYQDVRCDILGDGVSWHWFTADWDEHGRWSKRFIDDDARKRWEKRERRNARRAAYDKEQAA